MKQYLGVNNQEVKELEREYQHETLKCADLLNPSKHKKDVYDIYVNNHQYTKQLG